MKNSEQKQIITKISKSEQLSAQEMDKIYEAFKSNAPTGKEARSNFINQIVQSSTPEQFHQFVDQMFSHYTRENGPFDNKKESLKGEPNIFRTAGAETFNKDLIVKEAEINGFKATISMENGIFNASFNELPKPVLAHFDRFQEFVVMNKGELAAETFTRNLSFVVCNNILMEQAEKEGLLPQLMQSEKFQKASWLDHQKENILDDIKSAAALEKQNQVVIPESPKTKESGNIYIDAIKELVNIIFKQTDPLKFVIDLVKSALGMGDGIQQESKIPAKQPEKSSAPTVLSQEHSSPNIAREELKDQAVQILSDALLNSVNAKQDKGIDQEIKKEVSQSRG